MIIFPIDLKVNCHYFGHSIPARSMDFVWKVMVTCFEPLLEFSIWAIELLILQTEMHKACCINIIGI